ncbi:MBOAT family O-acyltransferase [Candidatus Nitrotoga sp. M5]|uniref:MBOAT family O-acyltransferase n=1 Tax=Candidatus Nitrotoga sp. M5 TaxID=2890409 RepID=UPI001EF228F1|nr:MBOAT family O-acyltransferase [Candidatus Nitrotoga sp. M5]CAH1386246.1 putative alginate O-acetylase AlgI [Candidatus Nitrotoga sp. M5]
MIFSSMSFMVFLVAVLFLYAATNNYRQRAAIILVASLVFYGSWNPSYLLLLTASLTLNYGFYRILQQTRSRAWLSLALVVNLSVLIFFKYLGLFFQSLMTLGGYFQILAPVDTPSWAQWALPLGVSFYTFHMLSVMIDVYRGDWVRPISFRAWSMYVTFFPHMIAGPILRASELVDQLEKLEPLKLNEVRLGALIFIGGLIKKTLFADNLAGIVEPLYAHPEQLTFYTAWFATLAFALQIYFDFSGYSEMAVGLARMFGVTLPRNFLYPYVSRSVKEFWQRWHITLSLWLRDYLYISLGGSRCSFPRNMGNLMITMLLGGLWHGAGWNFVFWGFLHGSYLILHRLLLHAYTWAGVTAGSVIDRILSWLGWPFTFILVCFTWVFFRANSFPDAWHISATMLGLAQPSETILVIRLSEQAMIIAALLLALIEPHIVAWFQRQNPLSWWRVVAPVRGFAYAILVLVLVSFGGDTQKFIYFDF